jgi:heat shock protein HtpX
MINVYEAVSSNKRKSTVVLVLFVVFVTAAVYFISRAMGIYAGYEPGGIGIAGIALIISGLMSLGSYYFSDRIVLVLSNARPAQRDKDFEFFTVAENLSLVTDLPKPKLYVIEDSAPNAFATGRDPEHAVVCATTGLLDKLSRTELEGVVAHELSHIRHYDTRLMSIVAVLVGMVALIGDWFLRMTWYERRRRSDKDTGQMGAILLLIGLLFAILAPIVAKLIQLAISRRREFLADAGAVSVTRQPQGLISALEKIAKDKEPLEVANKATAHLYIENPFKNKRHGAVDWFAGLFNTHPSVEERIRKLQAMA